jgi:hypothetical protein
MWEDVRSGAGYFHPRQPSLPEGRLRQFIHGLCLPFHLARLLLGEPAARRSYLRVAWTQAAVTFGLALLLASQGDQVAGRIEDELPEPAPAAQEDSRKDRVKEAAREFAQAVEGMASEIEAEARRLEQRAVEKEPPRPARSLRYQFVFAVALFSALQMAQWIVIALSRDYHDALSREASLRANVTPEDEPLTPRVRLDVAWVRRKLKRRWRAFVVFATGVPAIACVQLVPGGRELFPWLLSAWGAWWFVVFTASKSAQAWEDGAPRPPWFLRGLAWLSERIPLLRWGLLRGYASVWTTFTRPVFSPVACTERQPWPFAGLALTRALSALPLIRCFLRPLIPVAAAHLLQAHRAAALRDGSHPGPVPRQPGAVEAPPPAPLPPQSSPLSGATPADR